MTAVHGYKARAFGLDLSLTSTGIASSRGWTDRIRPSSGAEGFVRMREILEAVRDAIGAHALVVVESLALTRTTGQHLTRAGLWHVVMESVDRRWPWIEVSPTALKKYATGKGNAGKEEVLIAAIKRFGDMEIKGNDEADALWLAAMGADLLGEPMVELPAVNRTALAKLTLPAEVVDDHS